MGRAGIFEPRKLLGRKVGFEILITYREELLKRKQLISTNVELVPGLERGCLNAFLALHGEIDLINGS